MITGRQIRAARALLGISQDELATSAGLTKQGISKIEDSSVQPREGTMADILRVFSERGIEFTDNQGVRMRPSGIEVFEGIDRFNEFYEFMYNHLKHFGGDVCLSLSDESLAAKYRKNPQLHRQRMKELFETGTVTFRILTTKSDFVSHGYAKFKWQSQANTTLTGFYAFGDCLALMSFVDPQSPYIVVIQSGPMAEGYRQGFNVAWNNASEPPQSGKEQ
jgi:transcriptional regulator with XRE-family HTH domain